MAKIQTKHWITLMLYIIAIVLIIFGTVNGTENPTIQILGWVIMMIGSLYMIFTNVKRINKKK